MEELDAALGSLYACIPGGGALAGLSSYAFADAAHWHAIYYLGALVPLLALPGIILGVPNLKPLAKRKEPKPSIGLALFGEGRAFTTGILWLGFLFSLMTSYVLLSWLPSLLVSKGLPKADAALAQMTYNLLSVAGAIFAGMLIDRPAGRSRSIIGVFGAGIVALVILAAAPAQMPPGCARSCSIS